MRTQTLFGAATRAARPSPAVPLTRREPRDPSHAGGACWSQPSGRSTAAQGTRLTHHTPSSGSSKTHAGREQETHIELVGAARREPALARSPRSCPRAALCRGRALPIDVTAC